MIEFTLHIQTVSLANQREHWAVRARRAKAERLLACLSVPGHLRVSPGLRVTLTRVAPRELDDDNLRGSFKSIRDGIADKLGIDDRDPRVTWAYAQEKSKKKTHLHKYSVRVNIQ